MNTTTEPQTLEQIVERVFEGMPIEAARDSLLVRFARALLSDPAILAHVPGYEDLAEAAAMLGGCEEAHRACDIQRTTLAEFIKRIRIKTSAGESIEPELAQAMHYINEGMETHVSAYAELRVENDQLKDLFAEVASICLDHMPVDHATLGPLDAVRRVFKDSHGLRERIASLESQLAAANEKLAGGGEAVYEVAEDQHGKIWKTVSEEEWRLHGVIWRRILYTTPQPAIAGKVEGFDAEFLSKRLARVASLAGVVIPKTFTHEQVAEAAGTILGKIASEMLKPPSTSIAEQQWQPIETAPKDMVILIYQPRFNRVTTSINDGFTYTEATHWMPLPAPPSDSLGGDA